MVRTINGRGDNMQTQTILLILTWWWIVMAIFNIAFASNKRNGQFQLTWAFICWVGYSIVIEIGKINCGN